MHTFRRRDPCTRALCPSHTGRSRLPCTLAITEPEDLAWLVAVPADGCVYRLIAKNTIEERC
jgi:hypothetical protein